VCAPCSTESAPYPPYNNDKASRGVIAIVIYVDVLLVVNFMINFLLLRLVSLFSQGDAPMRRCSLGALVGALGTLVVFLPFASQPGLLLIRVLLAAGMIGAAFGGGRLFWRRVLLLYTVSFLFTGLMTAFSLLLQPRGMILYRGVISFDIGLPALFFAVAAGYGVSWLLSFFLHTRNSANAFCRLTVITECGSCTLTALIDTGCTLIEPFSSLPVAIVEEKAIRQILPKDSDRAELLPGWRLVRYGTLSGGGMMRAFRPSGLVIETANGACRTRGAYVALLRKSCGGTARAILNPAILETESEERMCS